MSLHERKRPKFHISIKTLEGNQVKPVHSETKKSIFSLIRQPIIQRVLRNKHNVKRVKCLYKVCVIQLSYHCRPSAIFLWKDYFLLSRAIVLFVTVKSPSKFEKTSLNSKFKLSFWSTGRFNYCFKRVILSSLHGTFLVQNRSTTHSNRHRQGNSNRPPSHSIFPGGTMGSEQAITTAYPNTQKT